MAAWFRRSPRGRMSMCIDRIVQRALANAGVTLADIDGVAAAAGPGLIGGVIVGLTTAKALALVTRQAADRGEPSRGACALARA